MMNDWDSLYRFVLEKRIKVLGFLEGVYDRKWTNLSDEELNAQLLILNGIMKEMNELEDQEKFIKMVEWEGE